MNFRTLFSYKFISAILVMCKLFIVPHCLEFKDVIVYGQPSPLGQTWTGRALLYVNWVQLNPVTSLNGLLIQLGLLSS